MMQAAHAAGDARQRHGAMISGNQQQQRMSPVGAPADSPYSSMRHPHSQQHGAGSYAMQAGPLGGSTDPHQHGGYNTGSPSAAGNGMAAGGGTAKRMSNMMPAYNAAGPRPGMQPHMGDMSVPQQMQPTHPSHVQHPSQANMMSQSASNAQAATMGTQGRDSAAGNHVARNARESFADGLPNFEPTPIDQIGLSADDDDFSDIADMLGGKSPGSRDGGQEMPQGHMQELTGDPYAANAQLTPGSQNQGQMVSPRQQQQWNSSVELMPQSIASPYSSPAAISQQQQHMHMQQPHGMGARSTAPQPNGQAHWMSEQQAHSQQMHPAHHMRMQPQVYQQGPQGYLQGQQGYGQVQGQQQGYAQTPQQHAAEQHHTMVRAQQEEQQRSMAQQQQSDSGQVCTASVPTPSSDAVCSKQ